MMRLILASSSPYRKAMLARLRLPFMTVAPDVDETPRAAELPLQTALRLATEKAQWVVRQQPGAVVIGADQLATLDGVHGIGKPGNAARARAQLRQCSGRTLTFHNALCVTDGQRSRTHSVPVHCQFRILTDAEIDTYLALEKPYDAAGSAKAEGLGIALMAHMQSDDPTAIIGLPLIALTQLLRDFGINPLQPV